MRGYLSVADKNQAKEIAVEDQVALYRIQERGQEVFVEKDGNVVPLGVADPTVSRKKDSAPVVIAARDEFIEVRNNCNSNPVKVDEKATNTLDHEVTQGAVATVKRDATVKIGYQTELKLVVERSRKREVNVEGEKVVMGDEVDQSTNVTDSVVNRSNIGDEGGSGSPAAGGGGGGGTTVDDSVVNRSTVGGGGEEGGAAGGGGGDDGSVDTDTQSYCDVHDRTFSGEECPECTADGGEPSAGPGSRQSGADAAGGRQQAGGGSDQDTKFCIHCGEKIPLAAVHCPSCGEQLPE